MTAAPAKALREAEIADRYSLGVRSVLLSGTQSLVRLLLEQKSFDERFGLETGGFVSGYRGSPLGGLDFALWNAQRELSAANIRFEPGLNEELAANAVWGTQQIEYFSQPRCRGVFGLWYGKNPGLDRIADVLKHANMEGTAASGGVLAATGDDPAAASSSIANQGEQAFMAAMSPVLYPATIEEIISLGLAGFALSRFCGLWVGFKLVADIVESSASVLVPRPEHPFSLPDDFELPPAGLAQRRPDTRWAQEERMQRFKLPAARAFARANELDRTLVAPPAKRLAFVAAGKAFRDLSEALRLLGLSVPDMTRLGLGLRKIALIWPLEDLRNADFVRGFGEVVVVEEKRAVIEPQLKELAYHWCSDQRPRIVGKRDDQGVSLIADHGETDPLLLARVILSRLRANAILAPEDIDAIECRLQAMAPAAARGEGGGAARVPHFCAGCPHGRSTRLPEGSQAMAGIGCHSMVLWMPDNTSTASLTQMGGEGATWIGAAPFVETPHIFQNLGDGTYFHSGVLAIRAAVAARASITYKVLVNGAVAMTGGQPVEGAPDAARIAWQLHAEGVQRIALLTGRGGGFSGTARDLPPGVWLADRDDLDAVMREFRTFRGVSAIIYDQICATEKRRLRKRGRAFADEPVVVINERICEGCGDCSAKSRCIAVRHVDTPFGAKRQIDQSTCNTDLSCMDGFCPSFVTLSGAALQPAETIRLPLEKLEVLPEPDPAEVPDQRPYGILIGGVGGSGLITIGAILGMAAHIEQRSVSLLDNTGLARKGGEVTTHVRIGGEGESVAARIPDGGADLVLAGDLASLAQPNFLAKAASGARAVVLDEAIPMLDQAIDPERPLPELLFRERIQSRLGTEGTTFIEAAQIARIALGDAIYTNMVLLGAAVQAGLIPIGRSAIERSIRLNGVSASQNLEAFAWGRLSIAEPAFVGEVLAAKQTSRSLPDDLDERIEFFAAELERYQDRQLAQRYRQIVGTVREAERRVTRETPLTASVIANAFKVLAVKDEFEVARLASDPDFHASLKQTYGPDLRLTFHFAPPFLPQSMTRDGRRSKRRFGPWMLPALRFLAAMRFLRGGVLDPFSRQRERRAERDFAERYCEGLLAIAPRLSSANYDCAIAFARLPEDVRGFGHVKAPRLAAAQATARNLMAEFMAAPRSSPAGPG